MHDEIEREFEPWSAFLKFHPSLFGTAFKSVARNDDEENSGDDDSDRSHPCLPGITARHSTNSVRF